MGTSKKNFQNKKTFHLRLQSEQDKEIRKRLQSRFAYHCWKSNAARIWRVIVFIYWLGFSYLLHTLKCYTSKSRSGHVHRGFIEVNITWRGIWCKTFFGVLKLQWSKPRMRSSEKLKF